MKIGILSTFPPEKCGIGVYAEEHRNALEEAGHDTVVFSDSEGADVNVDIKSPVFFHQLRRALKREEIDALHVHHDFSIYGLHGLNPSLINQVPVVTSFHTVKKDLPYNWYSVRSRVDSLAQRRLASGSARVVAHTKKDERWLSERYSGVEYIPLGNRKEEVSKSESLETLLYFGMMRPAKNVEALIESAEHHDRKIVIAGGASDDSEREYLERIEEQARGVEQVETRLHWFSDQEKKEVFAEADAVVLPYSNLYSGSGVLTDAISHALPVISSKLPVFLETVEEEGFGIAVEPEPEELAAAVHELGNDYSRFKTAAKEYRQIRSWENTVEDYIRIYREITDS